MKASRITIFAGHYGSGKTNLAVNYAFRLAQQVPRVALCDLDIVNPYFRTADAATALAERGIELITSRMANTNVDAPALPAQTRAIFDNRSLHAAIDLGGDDRGALALGRYVSLLREEGNYEMLLVINQYRPLTRDVASLLEIKDEIERAARVPFTGIVNNSNLGSETTLDDVLATVPFAQAIAEALSLPIKMTTVHRPLLSQEGPALTALRAQTALFPIDLYNKSLWRL